MIRTMDFDMVFGILIFDPKWAFYKGHSVCMMDGFLKCSHLSNNYCFFELLFEQNNSKRFVEWILRCFLEF